MTEKLPDCPVCGAGHVTEWFDKYGGLVEISSDQDEDDIECPHEFHGFTPDEYRALCELVEKGKRLIHFRESKCGESPCIHCIANEVSHD